MENLRKTLLLSLLFAVALAWPISTAAQSPPQKERTTTYEFVSPNTSEGMKLDEALKKLNSPKQQALIRQTRVVACQIGSQTHIKSALGVWSDGAENSTVFQLRTDEFAARYAAARLGSFAEQKAVLYFRLNKKGKGRLHVITVSSRTRRLESVSDTLERAAIPYRTLVPLRGKLLVYIVDLTNDLGTKVSAAARLLRSPLRSFAGTGALIGDDNNREKAQQLYAQEIDRYEATHTLRANCPAVSTKFRGKKYGRVKRRLV